MKETAQLLFIVLFFTAFGHWFGSNHADLGESIGMGFSAMFAVLLMLMMNRALDYFLRRDRQAPPITDELEKDIVPMPDLVNERLIKVTMPPRGKR